MSNKNIITNDLLKMKQIYEDDFLLDRIFTKLKDNKTKKLVVTKPTIEKKNGKTYITNFTDVCNSIKRDLHDIKTYIETELQIETSIMENGTMLINKIYHQKDIEPLFSAYIKTFVICPEKNCGSGNTEIIKEHRIKFLVCNVCKSQKSIVDPITLK